MNRNVSVTCLTQHMMFSLHVMRSKTQPLYDVTCGCGGSIVKQKSGLSQIYFETSNL